MRLSPFLGSAPQIAIATTTQGGATSEVQRVGFTAMMITGGTFTLTQGGQTTSNLAWNASAADVQAALEALSGVGSGNVAVSKLSNATNHQEWRLTFVGSLAGTNVGQTTVATGALTTMGGGPSAVQATDVQGGTNDEVQTVTLSNATDGVFRLAFGGAQAGLNVAPLQGDTANLLGLEKGTGGFSWKRPPSPFRRRPLFGALPSYANNWITIYAICNVGTK